MKNSLFIIFAISLLCFSPSNLIFAQTQADTLAAQAIFRKAQNLMRQGAFDSLGFYADRAAEAYLKIYGDPSAEYADALDLQARHLQNAVQIDQAYSLYQKILDIRRAKLGENHVKTAHTYNNIGSFLAQFREDYDAAIPMLEKAMNIYQKLGKRGDAAGAMLGISINFERKGDYLQATQTMQHALDSAVAAYGTSSLDVMPFYWLAGNRYFSLGNPAKSVEFFQKCQAIIRQNNLPPAHPWALDLRINLANALTGNHQFDAARKIYDDLIADCQKEEFGVLPRQHAFFLANAATGFQQMGDLPRSFKCLEAAADIQIQLKEDLTQLWLVYRLLAQAHFSNKDIAQTKKYLQLEHELAHRIPPLKPDDRAEFNRLAAGAAQAEGQFERVDSLLHRSLSDFYNFQNVSHFGLLSPEFAFRAIGQRIFFEIERFRTSQNPIFLTKAIEAGKLLEQSLQNFRLASDRDQSKTARVEEIRPALQAVIWANLRLSKFKTDENPLLEAFILSEKTRAMVLFEKLRENTALNLGNLKLPTLQRWNDLQLKIAETERRQFRLIEKNTPTDDPTLTTLNNRRFEQMQQLDLLRQQLQVESPDYFRLKLDAEAASPDQIRRDLLATDQALIEYFIGDSSIFIFKIEKEKFELREVKKDFPLERWVTELRDATTNFFTNPKFENRYAELAQVFTERSHQLYQKLVAPVAQNLPPRLVIVPDGVLGYLPFEALLTEPISAAADRWQQHNYLIAKHSVQYCPSATMLREMSFRKTKTEPTVSFCGFAPHFTGDTTALAVLFKNDLTMRKDLAPLPFSGEEVARLSKLMKGKYLAGTDASKSQFLAAAPNARILHLATHGQANDRAGDYCFLAFAKNVDAPEQSVLFAREIYNLNLNADLVVLSACETGIGQLQNGEGIISLARAFAYAGAKSIVTSFWSVSDAKTKDLMLDFYKNLRRGEPKDLALRQAKLDFLRKNRGQAAHPFFWAGFVGMGSLN